jgi:hypothetical protein
MIKTNLRYSESGAIAMHGHRQRPVYIVKSFEDLKNFPPGAV